jgi:hypothetical protein
MARIITKELAIEIVKKLQAVKIKSRNKAHDEYAVEHEGILLGFISIRRGSNKEQGHDYIPRELNISPHQARDLGLCPWKLVDYLRCMRDKGHLPPEDEDDEEDEGQAET